MLGSQEPHKSGCGEASDRGLDASLSSLYIRPRRTNMLLHPAIQSPDNAQLSVCLIPLHSFIPIQTSEVHLKWITG